jgi:anhydro-N-acetylmuramic acid kinase
MIQSDLLATLMADPFLTEPPPKSTGRERYGLPFCRDLLTRAGLEPGLLDSALDIAGPIQQQAADLIATATAFTAASIADAYRRWLPPVDEVFVGGGGGRNPTLMRALRDALAPVPVLTSEAAGVDPDAKEAIAFALLAHDALEGRPTNVPRATGARHAIPLGKIVRPPIPPRP